MLATWRVLVHQVVHPVSGAIVLSAAGVEVLEWLLVIYEHMDAMLRPAGG